MPVIVGGHRVRPSIAFSGIDQDISLLELRRLEFAPSLQHAMEAFLADPLIRQRLTTLSKQLEANPDLQKQIELIKAEPEFPVKAKDVYKKLAFRLNVFEEELNANPLLQQQLDKMITDPKLQHHIELVHMML